MSYAKGGSEVVSESFKRRADSAAFWEAWVGSVLSRAGLYTLHHPFTIAKNYTEVREHGQTWDLEAWCENRNPVKIEVKSVNLTFLGPVSHPHEDVNLCSKKSFDRKGWADVLGRDFLIVSRATGSIVWMPDGSEVSFSDTFDSDRKEKFTICTAKRSSMQDLHAFVEKVKSQRVQSY
jgi:hypothetical protein